MQGTRQRPFLFPDRADIACTVLVMAGVVRCGAWRGWQVGGGEGERACGGVLRGGMGVEMGVVVGARVRVRVRVRVWVWVCVRAGVNAKSPSRLTGAFACN